LETELKEPGNPDLKKETLIKDKTEMPLKTEAETYSMMEMFK
jgi:hypothetical protein